MKTKRYWLWGGFLLIGVIVLVGIILSILHVTYFNLPVLVVLPLFTQIFINPNSTSLSSSSNTTGFLSSCLVDVVMLFLVGVLLGLIYGKIKNRNKTSRI